MSKRFKNWLALEQTYSWAARRERFTEWLAIKIAWSLPKRLVMWCAFRVGAHATTGRYGATVVPELTFMDAIDRWER